MKKTQQILATIITLIILTFFVGSVQAQVWEGDYTISDSDDIAVLSGFTEVTGDLTIFDLGDDLTSLSGLENITSVGGNLKIGGNHALTSLSGLENITSVGGYLAIAGNDALTSLSGLENITSVVGYLAIAGNDALTSLSELENITSVGGYLVIAWNDALTSLSGLNNITSVGGELSIDSNPSLTSLSGLENLSNVGGNLWITNNHSLNDVCALYDVNLTGNNLYIYDNILLSMDTAYALESQLRYNGFTGTAYIQDNNGSGLVACDIDDDIDDDGVLNDFDECEDTPVDEIVNSYGCSIEQLVPCEGPIDTTESWKNHGKYVSALAKTANSFVYESLITEDEKDILMKEMASSDCGK
jgi:hypothetical protein